MKLVIKSLSEIKPYENNPRRNDGAVTAVEESIKQCGYIAPIIVDEDGVILAGHTRYKALGGVRFFPASVVRLRTVRYLSLLHLSELCRFRIWC